MRRAIALALMISLLLLAGCGQNGKWQKSLEQKRSELDGNVSFTANVTADLGNSIFECTLSCVYENGQAKVTVQAPETLTGISALIDKSGTTLEYDGLQLVIGTEGQSFSPMNAMPIIAGAIIDGHAAEFYGERDGDKDFVTARIYIDETTDALVRFDTDSFTPVSAELVYDSRTLIKCSITDFT